MPPSKKFSFKHECELPEEDQEVLPKVSPFASKFVKLGYRLRDSMTIVSSKESRQYFRSNASMLKEKKRHLGTHRYRFVIHPLSKMATRHQMIMFFLWMIILIKDPLAASFLSKKLLNKKTKIEMLTYVNAFAQLIMALDVVIKFFTGYIVHQTREIVLEPKRIVNNYLKTYFICDTAPLVSYFTLFTFYQLEYPTKMMIFLPHLLRFCRLKSMVDAFDKMLKAWNVNESMRVCLLLFILALLVIHWWTCILALVPILHELLGLPIDDSWTIHMETERNRAKMLLKEEGKGEVEFGFARYYLAYLTVVMCHFYGAGMGHYRTDNGAEMLVLSLVLMTGLIFYVYALSVILRLFGIVNISETKFDELSAQVAEYMRLKSFPVNLRKRIVKYYDYKYDNKYFSEKKIMDSLSEHLQMEVLLYNCRNLIDKVMVFREFSRPVIGAIFARLKQEIYLAGDVVMQAQDTDGKIYFILYGTCSLKLMSGKEVMHVEDGYNIGNTTEYGKKIETDLMYYIVAVELCDIYYLERNDILNICSIYPDIIPKIQSLVERKTKFYERAVAKAALEVEIKSTDVAAELRKGRILEQGLQRNALL